MVRLHGFEQNKRSETSKSTNTLAHYSKQDILEQYCISERGLGALENGGHSIFGCLSSHSNYSCSSRNAPSLLTGCLRQRVSSDENLYKLYSRNPCDFAPYPRKQWYPWSPNTTLQEQDLRSSYFRKRAYGDPRRFTWMPSEDESIRMEKPRSITDLSYRNNTLTQSKKHVSFARSHTLTSFDDAMSSLNSSSSHLNKITRSQERLLDLRKSGNDAITKQPKMSENVLPEAKVIKGPMKTQATQTEAVLAKKGPAAHINFSPRALQRAKMVSQAAQTNGFNGRKLTKSISEAGSTFTSPLNKEGRFFSDYPEHEPVHRTQSDEPPRSPFLTTPAPPPFLRENPSQSETSSLSKSEEHESEDSTDPKKEIFIDYKPQLPYGESKKPLAKTFSDGVILTEKKSYFSSEDRVVPSARPYGSLSHENIQMLDSGVECKQPHFQRAPIKDEGVCPIPLEENIYSSVDAGLQSQDSIDDEFHENFMYNRLCQRQESIETDIEAICERISLGDESIVPSVYFQVDTKFSPFASSDSLANEARDQSDDIWNESQVTVLQVDSGTDNGTALSTSETVSVSPKVPSILLSPSSKRKHLLMMQHQQKSSFDMDPLDEEAVEDVLRPVCNEKPVNTLEVPRMLQFAPIKPNKSKHQTRSQSPLRFRNFGEYSTSAESPLPAVVPELLLTATDSCKTNTTDLSESTTTDDYVTANSGTDSSRKSASFQVVPSLSPSVSPDANQFLHATEHVSINAISYAKGSQPGTGRSTPSDDSSSCGSYSIERSTPDLLKGRFTAPTPDPPEKPSWSDDEERSERRYSSSGYYESPIENDLKKSNEFAATKCREVNFNLSSSIKSSGRSKHPVEVKMTIPVGENKGSNDKGKRAKSRARSPMQLHKKNTQGRRSPYKDKTSPLNEDKGYKVTSDESSTGQEYLNPRKSKKNKDNLRRKSLPRSPTYQKNQKKTDNANKYQSNSLPSSLSRKKSKKHVKGWQQENQEKKKANTEESPSTSTKDTITLKAQSTESLRSVSPGSDSVFYSDPGGQALADQQGHCLHCGKEVVHENDGGTPKTNHHHQQQHQQFIVQPPAGFEDSPKVKVEKLFKKLDKRLKSEERGQQGEHRRYKRTSDMRAKSEERCGGAATQSTQRGRLRPMQNSPFCSAERLAAANSSPSVLPGAPEEENDQGLYAACYDPARWLHVDERQSNGILSPSGSEGDRRCSISSTESEHELCNRYQGIVHKNAHRKPYVDMYKRLHFKTFDCDKTIVVQRESGEFGFRIHGSKPVVVTAIENGTPAELSGLQVGDIIITVNGVNVLDKSHSDVVQIAHAGSDTLTLEVARTSLSPIPTTKTSEPGEVLSGYLWKLSGHGRGYKSNKWIRRWFSLRRNSCLYFYKTEGEKQPVGVVMLLDQNIQELDDNVEPSKLNKFVVYRNEYRFYIAADSIEERNRWMDEIRKCVNENQDNYLEKTKNNLSLAPSAISDPDCFGYLTKLGSQWKSWSRRYCVLKDAALYFYHDSNSTSPFGVTLLHGYKVQLSSSIKKHAFEVLAPDVTKKHYYFCAESDSDRKRWISALEYSIDCWMILH